MQAAKLKADSQGRKAKLANSYQQLLEEFSSKDLRSVGNYTLGRLIGKGSFGKVYLASHKLTNGSKVVLKSAKKDDSNLAREIHHHRQFLHPHIARLYEVIVTENLVWLVLEYCPGDELYNYLLKEGALPVDKVQKIFAQLVGAVSYVHNLSCVHRDLKLENILLDKNENVKLCDFGFTREYEGKSSYLQTFCGTVAYSAPEMLKGEKYAGEKVDIWSLGVILYAVLCGELPFDEDDEQLMRAKILKDDPKYPDHLPQEARALIGKLLSKRPLLRPTLSDILADPFLAEHAPQQQAILKLQQPSPFSTPLEKEVLERMRSAGVEIDHVIENVLAKRCDPLSGWWTLLLEKEERKHRRREQKRREKEAELRANRRLSAASSRRAPTLRDVDEEDGDSTLRPDPPKGRGRKERRSAHYPELVLTDLPGLPENSLLNSPLGSNPPPPIEKDNVRSVSSSRHRRPIPPPKEGTIRGARSRGSTLQLVTSSNPDLLSPNTAVRAPRRRHQYPFLAQLTHWKQWLITSTKRGRSPNTKASTSTPNLVPKSSMSPNVGGPKTPNSRTQPPHSASLGPPLANGKQGYPAPPRIYTGSSSNKRHSLSPSPLTPRSTFRRGSSGLRGRKSTSSSVSSIRSIHRHRHSHSKASSTSSNGSDAVSKTPIGTRSPHHSVKVLPATPTATSFPTNVRLVRNPPMSSFNESAQWGREGMGGPVFAKRKRSVFKGPMLNVQPGQPEKPHGHGHSRSTSAVGRRSGEQTTIEEEEEEVEEVDAFGPLTGEGVYVEVVFEEPEVVGEKGKEEGESKEKGNEEEKEIEKGAE
ncbi:CAMK/CAMKL protein kinase [Pseudogymnoascus sp. 03VT05]|nr:CAMK/CAMKL protein kinase [Pseudogymnoascus sp. 03VT05]